MTEDGKYLILSVEDNTDNQIQLLKMFENKSEYKVLAAPNGEIALKVLAAHKPDLILMDWEMPKMDGVTCLKEIKNNDKLKHIPVIMLTGMSYLEDVKIAMDAGAEDYIIKPYIEVDLMIRINKFLK